MNRVWNTVKLAVRNLTLHKLPEILEGAALGDLIGALVAEDQAERLAGLEEA